MEPLNQKSQIAQEYALLPANARQQILNNFTYRPAIISNVFQRNTARLRSLALALACLVGFCSLRSKRFQSSYCEEVRAGAKKKKWKWVVEGRRGKACPLACDHALSLCLCNLFPGGGHDTILSQITCKKARIWTFFLIG